MSAACRAAAFAVVLASLSPAHAATSDEDIVVHVRKDGPLISIEVECPVGAAPEILWEVLTDYAHMERFISNLESSRVESRVDNLLRVHQTGKASRGPLSIRFDAVREIRLVPQREIHSRLLSGDFVAATFVTKIVEGAGGARIEHAGAYVPNIWVPPVIGPALIEAETRKQFAEFRAEILRRAASTR